MGVISSAGAAKWGGLIDALKSSRSGDELSRWSPLYKLCGSHTELRYSELHARESIVMMKWP